MLDCVKAQSAAAINTQKPLAMLFMVNPPENLALLDGYSDYENSKKRRAQSVRTANCATISTDINSTKELLCPS